MNETDQSILDDIARGLTELATATGQDGRARDHRLADVTVVLLDDDNVIIGKYPLNQALMFLASDQRMDVDTNDISTRESAEVWASVDMPKAHSRAREKREEWEGYVSKLDRDTCVRLLEGVSIACEDDEGVDTLREAVAVSVRDGDIQPQDVIDGANGNLPPLHRDGPPFDAATATGMYDRDF